MKLVIEFDQQIVRLGFTAGNWFIRVNPMIRVAISSTVISPTELEIDVVNGGPGPPVALVSYSAGVPNLEGISGLPVSSFTDFPINVVPF